MKGSTLEEPMTIYRIIDIKEDELWALSVCITNSMVQGLDIPNEYDKDIPSDAVMLAPDTYDDIKQSMKDFLQDTADYLKGRLIKDERPVKIGDRYYDGYIETVTRIEDGRVYYDLFRLEPENVSPYWTGNGLIADFIESHAGRISEETYSEVLKKYKKYVAELRYRLLPFLNQLRPIV